jgi:hypothetical protein
MLEATKPLCANIGFVDFAKKAMDVNFYMNMTCPKCPNVTSIQDLVSFIFSVKSLSFFFILLYKCSLCYFTIYKMYLMLFSDACHNKECPFLHIDPESKIRDCPWYDRGFCRHGPSCRHRHVRRVLCMNYLSGFCPKGGECSEAHPKFELPPIGGLDDPRGLGKKIVITCHYCGEPGHKVSHCSKVPPEVRDQHAQVHPQNIFVSF